ncbi:helix-turn-helix domain-containing protein [Sphingobacterium faecium]|jgi:AraC-like DNA-binding protein|uniref:helix-turn-helix domain-containing protein n=1 Tax=Sphingobacterium faecium TaxID=34087 RepID=UPI00097F17C0|nr:AraC family transcriptional regulator [Sphingobacterium faecium]UXD68086.1 AraC family transcriptional regulator [Sphingobacterium faecium]WGQ15795.1 AraC family transcriptional regulator [Sphingobacterium faecium]SJN48634.1 Transcriptional regulator, AraC family [Sphingobacterium faecium PCAi_F2.5]
MPINFLGNIKLAESLNAGLLDPLNMPDLFFKSEHILGAYVFSCTDIQPSQPLFNDGNPCLIFLPKKTDVVHLKNAEELIKLNAAWVCCGIIQNTYWQLPVDLSHMIVIRFKPASFYKIFNIEPHFFLKKPFCSFSDIMNKNWTEILNQLYQKETLAEQMQLLKSIFSTYKIAENHPYLLQSALEKIDNKKGNITVSALILELGGKVNRKWLQRSFMKYLGISPKKYISLQRFIFMYGKCQKNTPQDVLSHTFTSGYYDYNHFLKEFKQIIGVSPTHYNWK